MEIRDPVHGPIRISPAEREVVDHPLMQRLRRVSQLGFGEQAFPGATHTRFLHSLGTMHLAGLAMDALRRDLGFMGEAELSRARQALRLAALLHDLGHPPFSHSGERVLPSPAQLGIDGDDRDHVLHEEMTCHLVKSNYLGDLLDLKFGDLGVTRDEVLAILLPQAIKTDAFTVKGIDILPLLRQLISSELDVDRMDYLLRDSYFTGVEYGRFDLDWLFSHLRALKYQGSMYLGLDYRAVFTFEDFLLSRFHMFLMVYSHHKTTIYNRLLERYLSGEGRSAKAPPAPEAFERCDDHWLLDKIAAGSSAPAVRIASHDPLKVACEVWDEEAERLLSFKSDLEAELVGGCEWVDSAVEFSRYFRQGRRFPGVMPMVVITGTSAAKAVPIEQYTDLFERQSRMRRVVRLYCDERELESVRAVLRRKGLP